MDKTSRLRNDCNRLGLSCRDHNGKYLTNAELKKLISQATGSNKVGIKYARGQLQEKEKVFTLVTSLRRPVGARPVLPTELIDSIVEKLPATVAEKSILVKFHNSMNDDIYEIHVPYNATLLQAKQMLTDSIMPGLNPARIILLRNSFGFEPPTPLDDDTKLKDLGAKSGKSLELSVILNRL